MVWFLLAVVVLAGAGFVYKLVEFMATLKEDPSQSFALMPIVTYLCVAAGFFCLLLWAALSGHFRNVESVKERMLENERELDRRLGFYPGHRSGPPPDTEGEGWLSIPWRGEASEE
jgi:hypothetical protein